MVKKIIMIIGIITIVLFSGCSKGDFSCSPTFNTDYIILDNYSECANYVSDSCNMNITKDFCKNYEDSNK